jgi:hypothetical protein
MVSAPEAKAADCMLWKAKLNLALVTDNINAPLLFNVVGAL